MNSEVDQFLSKAKKWKDEMTLLRSIVLDCNLTESYKWMHPCYTLNGSNIVLIHQFKEYCALLFFKGVLIKDTQKILIQQTKNVQDRRQLRFTSLEEIELLGSTIKKYIMEAIKIEQTGLKVAFKKTEAFEIPNELKQRFQKMPTLKTAFESLTPGRQRAYLLFFSSAKQAQTREARIDKYSKQILSGKGLND